MDNSLGASGFESSISLQEDRTIVPYFPVSVPDTIASTLSLAATTTMLIVLYLTKAYQAQLHKMVLFLLFADFLHTLAFVSTLIHYPSNTTECKVAFAVVFFGKNSSLFWSATFAYILMKIVASKDFSPAKLQMRYFCIFTMYLPIIIALAMVLSSLVVYCPEAKKCGRYETVGHFDYGYFLLSGVPLLFSVTASIFCYVRAGSRLKLIFYGDHTNSRDALVLVLYPAIMIFCWGPQLVWGLLSTTMRLNPSLVIIPKVCLALHGFLNSLVYGFSPKTRQDIRKLCSTPSHKEESLQRAETSIMMTQSTSNTESMRTIE